MIEKTKNTNYLAIIFIIFFFIIQLNNISLGGTTIDERSIDNGNTITYEKLKIISKLDIVQNSSINPKLKSVSKMETYGQFISFQQFYFSRLFVDSDLLNNFFDENNIFSSFYSKTTFLRYFYLNIYVSAMLLIIYFFLSSFKNEKFAFLFIILLVLTPSFSGHSLFNQKDISFMFHIFFACLLIVHTGLNKNNKLFYFASILSGISISLRISGIIFIFVTVLFSIIYQLNLEKKSWSKVISYCSKFSAISVFTFLLVSPASWFSPIEFISTSLNQQIFLGWTGSTLTNGTFIPAKNISSFYLITWFFYKLPIVYNLLIVASILGLYFNVLRKDIFYQFSVYFLLFVNIAFALYKPEVYDGIRQFLFLLPFIIYISTCILLEFNKKFKIFIPITILYLIFTQYGLGPYKYVYFNELTDEQTITYECQNIDGCGDWLTDYWGFSGQSLTDYINRKNIQDVYFCKTIELWDLYVDESLNPIYDIKYLMPEIPLKPEVYVATIYRPRLDDDGCNFIQNNINYDCKIIHRTEVQLRNNNIDLNYLKKCTLSF